jgi:hypothetical protein
MLVQDAAYMVTVPNTVALTAHLQRNPVICYVADRFQRPYPFTPDVAVDIDASVDWKIAALHCHVSQYYEWLPYHDGVLDQVPAGEAERRDWLSRMRLPRYENVANRYRPTLVRWYGAERAEAVRYAEAFEICEYGSQPDEAELRRLFPFFP